MGHAYIERLPRTKPWRDIVAAIAAGADARAVAEQVIHAARAIILPLPKDDGVVEATWHLIRLPLAARADDFPASLRRAGVDIDDAPGLMDLLAATSDALDAAVPPGRRTDLGEMAQTALTETLADAFGTELANLFGEDPGQVRDLLAAAAAVRPFGRLAAGFFARVVRKVLDFFVSRALVDHVGAGRRFRILREQQAFADALGVYAREVAAGVDAYAGGWLNKWAHAADGRISRDEAGRFLAHAADKLDWALNRG
jgi:hypothetical protein